MVINKLFGGPKKVLLSDNLPGINGDDRRFFGLFISRDVFPVFGLSNTD
jgi:hypothetical protein